MNSRWQSVRYGVRFLILFTALQIGVNNATAQSPAAGASPAPQASPKPSPTPSLERQFLKNIFQDQRAIWTSPLRLSRGDAKWAVPLGLSTAALIATDQETDEFGHNRRRISVSKDISLAGSTYATGGIVATFYLAGRATGNRRARETGILGAEALINGGIVFSVLKNISQRQRPDHDEGLGEFFEGGHSFPSGHATSAWALATVIANEYRTHRAVQIGAYGIATMVSISRYTGRNHFLSDVLVGSAIGYGIGRFVYRRHHDPSLDLLNGQTTQSKQSKYLPLIEPMYNRSARNYGVTLAWSF